MRLMHAGVSFLQFVPAWIGSVSGETEPGAFQRKVDFSLTQDSGPISRSVLIRSYSRRRGSCAAIHTLKPETEPFSSTASSVSSPIDTAVSCVLVVVWPVIRRMSCIESATLVAMSA